jgi:hypothetical protein
MTNFQNFLNFGHFSGKVFPKLRRKGRGSTRNKKLNESNADSPINDEEEEEPTDYVFRIIATFEKPDTIRKNEY